jgi:hypothetical protein
MHDKRFRSDRGRDPIAELARLIAQTETHEEGADNWSREEIVSEEALELPPAPQLTVGQDEHEQGSERDEHCSGIQAHDIGDQPFEEECQDNDSEVPHYAAEEEYQDSEVPHYAAEGECQDNEVPRVRRHGLTLVMAIFGFALVGTACAVGYRNMFGGPILPQSIKATDERNSLSSVSDPQAASGGNTREAGPATTGSIDNRVSREYKPAAVGPSKAVPPRASMPWASTPATPAAGQAVPKQAVPRATVTAPAPRLTIAAGPQGPDQSGGVEDTTASNREHLAAVPVAHADPDTRAAMTAPVVASGYAVQVTSERSESRAQAAFRALQAKYPNQLSGHQPIIRRADLGAAGIYYRALVGPFASAEKAAKMCSGLKAAGGDCVIQKN